MDNQQLRILNLHNLWETKIGGILEELHKCARENCDKMIPLARRFCSHSCCMRFLNESKEGIERNRNIMRKYNKSSKHTKDIIKSNCTRMIQRAGGEDAPLNFYILLFEDTVKIGVAVNLHVRIIRYRKPILKYFNILLTAKQASELEMKIKLELFEQHIDNNLELFPMTEYSKILDIVSSELGITDLESKFNDYHLGCV